MNHCFACAGDHEPDAPGAWVRFVDRQFTAPFRCLCCGRDICARQFAFGRCCALCDTGLCQSSTRGFQPAYAHAPWAGRDAYIESQPSLCDAVTPSAAPPAGAGSEEE